MTNSNHPSTVRTKMVRVDLMLPTDVRDELARRAAALPEDTVSSVARRLLRSALAAEAAA